MGSIPVAVTWIEIILLIMWIAWIILIISVKKTNVWDNMLYLKVTWACLSHEHVYQVMAEIQCPENQLAK